MTTRMAWIKPFLFILVLALLAFAGWFVEINYFIGWEGAEWLSYNHYSVFGIAALVVIAYLLPLYLIARKPMQRLWKAGVELYFVVLAAYFLEKLVLITLYTQFYGFLNPDWLLVMQVLVLVMTVMSFHFVTQRWLESLRWQQTLVFGAAMLLPYPLSLLSVQYLFNFSNDTLLMDAVKMGYPFFWITLLMGIAGLIATQNFTKTLAPPTQEDILDDLPEEE